MRLIYFLALGAVLYVNLAAVTLVMARYLPSWAIARAAGLLGFSAILFFTEHFVGLGSLYWALPLVTALFAFCPGYFTFSHSTRGKDDHPGGGGCCGGGKCG